MNTSAGSDATTLPLGGRSALALTALIAGVVFSLVRAGAPEGYGPFAAVIAGVTWLVVWTLAALVAVRPMVRLLSNADDRPWENEVLAAVGGTGVLIVCAVALSLLGLFRPWPLLATLLVWAAVGAIDVLRRPMAMPQIDLRVGPLVGLAGLTALLATSVSPFYDQWHQHLGFPWVWLQTGSIHTLPHDWYSFMPVKSSLLFAYGLGSLGQWSAQIIHWWCGVVTVLAVAGLAGRSGYRSAPVWAVWIFATTPVALHLATTAGSDLVVTMFAGGAWISLLRTADDQARVRRWWIATGVCIGLAAGTKYVAFGSVAIPVAVGALFLHRPWKSGAAPLAFLGHAVSGLVAAMAVFSPWAIRNYVATGNPLFPFANRAFASTLRLPADSAVGFSNTLSGLDLTPQHLVSGLDLGSFGASIDGFPSIGFVYIALIAMAALKWVKTPPGASTPTLWAGAITGIGFWLMTMHVSRYLVPVLIPLSAILGSSMATLRADLSPWLRRGTTALVGLLIALTLSGSVTAVGVERLGIALGVAPMEPLLARWVSSTPAFEVVESLPTDARVFMVGEARALGFDRPVVFSDPYRDPLLLDLVRSSTSAVDVASRLDAMGMTHLLANHWEAVRSARLRGNKRFFVINDPSVSDRLRDFSSRCLDPMWNDAGLYLYRLVPDCSLPPTPGGADLASW